MGHQFISALIPLSLSLFCFSAEWALPLQWRRMLLYALLAFWVCVSSIEAGALVHNSSCLCFDTLCMNYDDASPQKTNKTVQTIKELVRKASKYSGAKSGLHCQNLFIPNHFSFTDFSFANASCVVERISSGQISILKISQHPGSMRKWFTSFAVRQSNLASALESGDDESRGRYINAAFRARNI